MNAAEKIQAAIDKLEALNAGSTQGPWELNSNPSGTHRWITRYFEFFGTQSEDVARLATGPDMEDGELIEVLHRTIDAQLAILRAGSVWLFEFAAEAPTYPDGRAMGADRMYKITPEGRATLSLADAILGGA